MVSSLAGAPGRAVEYSNHVPSWARWSPGLGRRYTLGVEEELMLLDPIDYSLAERSGAVMDRLPADLRRHTSPRTHAAVLELKTGARVTPEDVAVELAGLRRRLARELAQAGLAAACSATHPVEEPLGSEPTMALHIHVGVPDPEDAIRVCNRLRESVPVLLALSANSPFRHGRDSGFCSTRTVISDALPRTDVRPHPSLGTVEVRALDVQMDPRDTASLAALVQSLARCELEGSRLDDSRSPEVLAENRFLAARDGLDARLLEPRRRRRVPARKLVFELIDECGPHAAALGCITELHGLTRLAVDSGADRQRAWSAAGGVQSIIRTLADRFALNGGPAALGQP